MIIVSQERNGIINFESFNVVAIDKSNSTFKIIAMTDGMKIKIAEYETEKRAKEVLKEIIEKNFGRAIIQYKYPTPRNKQVDDAEFIKEMDSRFSIITGDYDMEIKNLSNDNMVYYMPKE